MADSQRGSRWNAVHGSGRERHSQSSVARLAQIHSSGKSGRYKAVDALSREPRYRRSSEAWTARSRNLGSSAGRFSPSATAADPAAATAAAKPEGTLSVDDFVRAAGDRQPGAAVEANGNTGGEVTESGDAAVSSAATDAVTPPAARPGQRLLSSTRVDGFSAEGLPTPEVKAGKDNVRGRLPGKHAAAQAPSFSPAEQAEITEEAVKPMVLPGLYSRTGRLVMPAPLKGSREILVHQNLMADEAGLERIQDDAMLDRMRASHQLVNLTESSSMHVNPELPFNRRYARPWTVQFAVDISRQFSMRFHQPLQVNSAVRTVEYQLRLQRVNGNAASVDGDVASPHLTGQALDFGKRGMSMAQIAWMRAYLMPFINAGKIDVEEEFQQACFHVSVYRSYGPRRSLRTEEAQLGNVPRVSRPVLHVAAGTDADTEQR